MGLAVTLKSGARSPAVYHSMREVGVSDDGRRQRARREKACAPATLGAQRDGEVGANLPGTPKARLSQADVGEGGSLDGMEAGAT